MAATLESIKRRATQMKKAALEPLKHAHALEACARAEGFNSYAHARAFLLGRTEKGPTT